MPFPKPSGIIELTSTGDTITITNPKGPVTNVESDGGGGGGITLIESTDASVSVLNGEGPTVDLSVAPSAGSLPGLSGDGDPIVANPLTPAFIGQLYQDVSGGTGLWRGVSKVEGAWASVGGDSLTVFNGPEGFVINQFGQYEIASQAIHSAINIVGSGIESTINVGIPLFWYSAGAGNPATPVTIVTGTNDTFLYNGETFTVAPGVLNTVVDIANAMNAAIGSASGEAFDTICGVAALFDDNEPVQMHVVVFLLASGDVLADGPTDFLTAVAGITAGSAEAGGDKLGFFTATAIAQPTVTGALSTVVDPSAKAVLTSLLAAFSATAGFGLVLDGTT